MSDYAKLSVSLTYSENSDYSDPEFISSFEEDPLASPSYYRKLRILAATTGTTVSLGTSADSDPTYVIIQNQDTSNYVVVTYDNYAGTAVAHKIYGGQFHVASDFNTDEGLLITANTAACIVDILSVGV